MIVANRLKFGHEHICKRHTGDVLVRWPGQTKPTGGLSAHRIEGVQMFKTFPDNHSKTIPIRCFSVKASGLAILAHLPYSQVLTKSHDGSGGKTIPPTNKKFQVDFCKSGHWKNGQNRREEFFYDQEGMLRQLGLTQ
jgi:hypothetical protein